MVNNSAQSTLGELRDPDAEVDGLARSLPSGRGSRSAVGLFRPLRIFGNLLNGINLMLAVQSCLQKFSVCLPGRNTIRPDSSHPSGGAYRDRHGRWGGMRWTRRRFAREVIAGRVPMNP